MPIINVQLISGRAPELKEKLIADLTGAAVAVLGVAPQSVRVILTEVPADCWGVAGTSKAAEGAAPG